MDKTKSVKNLRDTGQSIYEKIICFEWVMVVVYFIARPVFDNGMLTQLIWIPSLLIIFVFSIHFKLTVTELISIFVPFLILLFSIVVQGAFASNQLLGAFCYMTMIIIIIKCSKVVPTDATFNFIFYSCAFLSVLFVVYSFTPLVYMAELQGKHFITTFFVFNLGNSNTASMYLFTFLCVLLINLPYRKYKVLILLLIAFDLYMIFRTECRSIFVTSLIVIAAYFLFSKKRLPKPVIVVCVFIPVLFALIYLYMFYIAGVSNFVFMNEKTFFSGRQNNYYEYLSMINGVTGVLFGNFAEAHFQNAENAPLAVFATIGLVGLIAFYVFYISSLFRISDKPKTQMRTVALFCILGVFLGSSTEASYFLGGFPGNILVATFFLLSNYVHSAENHIM